MKNRILIVEDDAAIAEAIGLNLMLSDYDYKIIDDGAEAASSISGTDTDYIKMKGTATSLFFTFGAECVILQKE